MGENLLQVLAIVLLVPVGGALIAHKRGHHGTATVLNAVVPVLTLGSSALTLMASPSPKITPGGSVYLFPPVLVLLVAPGARLFWLAWSVNVAIVAFLIYLAFFFRIF